MTEKSGPEERDATGGVPTERATAEAKRLAARRTFLLGGASALPLIVTLGQKEAWAASANVCRSLDMSYDRDYVEQQIAEKRGDEFDRDDDDRNEFDLASKGQDGEEDGDDKPWGKRRWGERGWGDNGLAASLYCDPSKSKRWT